jgi:WD40 repeat protein
VCAQSQRTFEGHSYDVYALALSPNGKTLYSGSVDKTIRAWSTESGAVRPRDCCVLLR